MQRRGRLLLKRRRRPDVQHPRRPRHEMGSAGAEGPGRHLCRFNRPLQHRQQLPYQNLGTRGRHPRGAAAPGRQERRVQDQH